jgi:predicted nucleic acid-binding protein
MAARYLLDSNVCIYAMKLRSQKLLRRLDRSAPVCALSVIVYGERRFGRTASARRDEATRYLAALLETIEVLPLPGVLRRTTVEYGPSSRAQASRLAQTTPGSPRIRSPRISLSSRTMNVNSAECAECVSRIG